MILQNCNQEVRVGRQCSEIRESMVLVPCKPPPTPGVSSSKEPTPSDEAKDYLE